MFLDIFSDTLLRSADEGGHCQNSFIFLQASQDRLCQNIFGERLRISRTLPCGDALKNHFMPTLRVFAIAMIRFSVLF